MPRPYSLLPLLVAALLMGSAARASPGAISVDTSSGTVVGQQRDGAVEFRGIRYAQPPLGPLRWAPPKPIQKQRSPQTDSPAASCPQSGSSVFGRPSDSEDCLFLNIFVPAGEKGAGGEMGVPERKGGRAAISTQRTHARPVIVWLHGGGLFSGSGADYDGSKLAQSGDVVVVTLNYRLGALGFLANPTVLRDSHGVANFGLLDQRLALAWVRRNIAAFGGNPAAITLAGQSSGATAVVAHLVSPDSAGLFSRAIVQSATRFAPLSREQAQSVGESFARSVGCGEPTETMSCLRRLSVQTILDHQQALIATTAASFFVPDRVTGALPPLQAFNTGRFNRMPVVTGLTADEQAYFLPDASKQQPLDEAAYLSWARQAAGSRAAEVLQRYPIGRYGSPSLAEIAAAQDNKRCVVLKLDVALARFVPVYAYEFADRSAPSYFRQRSYPMRAYHTAELQYLFPLFHGARGTPHALNATQESLAQNLILWWSSFARTGTPGTPGAPWPAFRPDANNVLAIGGVIGSAYTNDACAFWDALAAS